MKPKPKRALVASLALLSVLMGLPSMAVPVTISDPSFEENTLSAGGYTTDINPWVRNNYATQEAFKEYITGFSAQGTDHLGMELSSQNGRYVYQDLGVNYQANTTYTLTVAVGNRPGFTSSGNISRYRLSSPSGNIATGEYDAFANVSSGTFADAPPLVLNTAVTTAAVGLPIRIRFEARGNGRSHFDNIRLDATSNIPAGSPTVANSPASSIGQTTATLNGTVTSIGSAAPSITLFYGTTNGGTNAASWQNSLNLSGTWSGAFSGNISGLSPNTTYWFTARATNASGTAWATPSLSFDTLPAPATIIQSAATNIQITSATIPVEVTSTGGNAPIVTVHYGATDGGTNAAAWTGSAVLGTQTGAASANLTGLTHNTTYYYRAKAVNSAGTSWTAASGSFTTPAILLPTIENRTPQEITGTTATLRGQVIGTGNETPAVTLFYGTADGGTVPGSWPNNINLGLKGGEFSKFVSGLSATTTYHFRFRATNSAGSEWTDGSTFTTLAFNAASPVISEIHYGPADDPIGGPVQHEFVEIHNPGDSTVNLGGWTLTDAVTFAFPSGTLLEPGAYLCVAQNPTAFQAKFGFAPLGPFTGKLSNEGDNVVLSNAMGITMDEVGYQSGFPWPTSARGTGPSMELIHPSMDNSLGGSWRSGGTFVASEVVYVAASSAGWKYLPGTEEASSPVDAWRQAAFNDGTWSIGTAAFGYGGGYTTATNLSGMQGNHSSVYYRKAFQIATGNIPESLTLSIKYDDGAIVWINGTEVARRNVPAGELAHDALALANHPVTNWETITLSNADAYLNGGDNVITVQSFNSVLNGSSYFFDLKLSNFVNNTAVTPGAQNSAAATLSAIPPVTRQVSHSPNSPTSGVPVLISAKVTDNDGLSTVTCAYQSVMPGSYIRKTDAAYTSSWSSLVMKDDGTGGDVIAGDDVYSCTIPANVQTHRRLVRFTITATDSLSNSVKVPYADDEQPNFAYFVYDGVPSWTGAFRPTSFAGFPATTAKTFDSTLINSLPPYHLIANGSDVENCQYNGSYQDTRFTGTLVYDGVVYDHIQFKVRGQASTYNTGKNKWNVFFNRARDLQARDNQGKKYKETWNNLVLNANACPWAAVNRGAAGVDEATCARIYELAGNTNFKTHYVHWRVIDSATEQSPTSQYDTDLWGLYLGLEPTEGNMLDERGLPDGNIYAIEGNGGDKKHQGEGQPVDSSDWNNFRSSLETSGQSEAWYRANMDLPKLYTFLGLNRLTGNVDVRPGDNYRYYHRGNDNKWEILAYDLDMQYIAAHHWGGGMDGVNVAGQPNSILAIMRHPALALEYRNRCRELLDLVASDASANGGQIGQLIDEYARLVDPAGSNGNSWAYLDAHLWNLHTRANGSGSDTGQNNSKGNFFRANYRDGNRGGLGGTSYTNTWIRTLADPDGDGFSDFQARADWFVNFATNTYPTGAAPWVRKATNTAGSGDDTDANRQKGYGYKYLEFESLYGGFADSRNEPTQAADLNFPNTPTITYTGSANYPANDVRFATSAFTDPNGNGTFSALQWRLAEISAPGIAGYVEGNNRKYEVEATWESGDLASFTPEIQYPVAGLKPGSTYRARVRHKDNTGRYSHWSAPVQFTVTAPDVSVWQDNLMITEIMYHPAAPTAGEISAGGSSFKDDYEFIELRNISNSLTLDLTELRFTKGADFDFKNSAFTSLAPGAFAIVVKNLASFQARYGMGLPVAGVWDAAANLSNSGEQIKLSYGAGVAIHDINPTEARYDQAPWPTSPDGTGPSLTLKDPFSAPNHDVATNWRASYINNGSPGTVDNVVTIHLASLSHTYDGFSKSATYTTTPAGVAVVLTYNGSGTAPTDGGSYTVMATSADPLFEGSSSATMTIAPAAQAITFSPPASVPFDGNPLALTATAGSGLPVSFGLVSGPATLLGNVLTPTGSGPLVVRASQAGNGNHQPAADVDTTITVTSDYGNSDWKTTHFTPAELLVPAVSGPLADPDGDGFSNLIEFSMNLDPKASDRHRGLCVYQEVEISGQTYPAITIRRRIGYPGMTSIVEASLNLSSWNHPVPVETDDGTDNGDGTETIQFRSPLPLSSQNRQWLRLRVTAP